LVRIDQLRQQAYGALVSGDVTQTPFLFNGMYGVTTDESGLYYMRARFYSPEIKRFVNQDILLGNVTQGQTLNRFAFVTGSPIGYVDPEGELGILAGALIGISIWAISEIVLPTLFPPDIIDSVQKGIFFIGTPTSIGISLYVTSTE